jgi:plasmid stabilization system protein ParE
VNEAKSRELPTVELVDSSDHPGDEFDFAARESSPISPADELSLSLPPSGTAHEGEMHDELQSDDDWLPVAFDKSKGVKAHDAKEPELGISSTDEELNFDDLDAMLSDEDSQTEPPEPASLDLTERAKNEAARNAAEDDEPLDLEFDEPKAEVPPAETPEEAARRIDAWFKSAKTLADVPALGDVPAPNDPQVDYHEQHETTGPSAAATSATIDLSSANLDIHHMNEDFELDSHPGEEAHDGPTWDDSHRMDQLLADFEEQPPDELAISDADVADHADTSSDSHDDSIAKEAAEWTPAEMVGVVANGDTPRRKKSFARTFAMTAFGGLFGLAAGYYVLLWILGPQGDFLNWANTLPKVVLPSSFAKSSRLMVSGPIKPVAPAVPSEEPAATEPEPNSNAVAKAGDEPAKTTDETPKAADEAVKTADATASPGAAPAEKQASFTEPADAKNAPEGDRYAITTNKPAEPATLDAPPAEPMKDAAPAIARAPIHITGTPTFGTTDLTAAIAAGKGAEAGLVNGNLTDGRDVARTKGLSYSILADLAQKTTFVDTAAADAAALQQEADAVYRELLATPHAREEVAQILPKWMASPNRKHAGVFFAGSVVGHEAKGSVTECNVEVGNGQSLPVIMSTATAELLNGSAAPVAVVGWIVDKPAEKVPGYTGTATQAIFAGRLVPLQ